MPKKSNTRRSDGRIAVQVYLGQVDGKRKYKTVYGSTQKEADQKAEELKIKLNKGIDINKENDNFETWSNRWLQLKSSDVCYSQHQLYKYNIERLNRFIGQKKLKDIKTFDIQSIITQLSECNPNTNKPASKSLLKSIKQTASQVFRFAIENRTLDFNPAEFVKIPKDAKENERRALSSEERQWIIDTPHRMQTAAMIMLFAGLRRGEIIPLLWSDIDLKTGTITVSKAVEMVDRTPRIKSTKTKSGLRTVYIPEILKNYLLSVNKTSVLVCPAHSGEMFSADTFKTAWNSYLSELDVKYGKLPQKKSKFDPRFSGITIDKITPHMLRHTFCTMMYENGIDVMTAKNQMGHSDINTTLNIYTHLNDEHTALEMQKMNAKTGCKSNASQSNQETS